MSSDEERAARFAAAVKHGELEQVEQKLDRAYVDICKQLAPVFELTPADISKIWFQCTQYEEEPLEAFRAEMRFYGMQQVVLMMEPPRKASGRPKRDHLIDIILDLKKTRIWKAFKQASERHVDGLVLLIFRLTDRGKYWVLSNCGSVPEPLPLTGRIVFPVSSGEDLFIMPLAAYIKERTYAQR